jgi:hypothetical protein
VEEMPFIATETVSMPPGPLGPLIVSVHSVLTSPLRGEYVPEPGPEMPVPFF